MLDPTSASLRALLLDRLIPFWFRHGVDHEHGGVLSSMTEEGAVLSTDKYLWSQGRWLWVVSALYNRIDARPEYLEAARQTAAFLLRHGRDAEGRWLFATTREGAVRIGHTSIFSDCFAVYGLSEYFRATRDQEALDVALHTFHRIRRRVEEPDFHETAPAELPPGRRAHAVPMILTEVANELLVTLVETGARPELLGVLGPAVEDYALRVMDRFVRPEWKALVEFLDYDYQPLPPPEGTAVEPGHAIESMWFVMHWARHRGRIDIVARAAEVIRWHLERGWDPEYGGLFLAVDALGHQPPFIANADKKVWWPHTEALYALLLTERLTGAAWCRPWYDRVAAWCQQHFDMPETGEWRQRLDRTGRPITELIALPVKDPFHLPRAVILMIELLEAAA